MKSLVDYNSNRQQQSTQHLVLLLEGRDGVSFTWPRRVSGDNARALGTHSKFLLKKYMDIETHMPQGSRQWVTVSTSNARGS